MAASDINLDIDVLLATNELFKMLLRVWMHGEKHWTAQRQLETLFILGTALQFLVSQSDSLMNKTLLCKEVGELSPCSKLPKGHVWICPFMSQTVILGLLSTNFQLKSLHLPWIRIYTAYVLESRLISMDGTTQIPISEFEARRWHRSVNSKAAYWPNTSSWQRSGAGRIVSMF